MSIIARKYYVETVLPDYREFISYRKSNEWGENQLRRKGITSAISLFHLLEHIYPPNNVNAEMDALIRQFPDFGLVKDIANASKHNQLVRGNPQISNDSQIIEALRLIIFKDDLGVYTVPQLEVYAKLNNGQEIKLLNLLHSVLSMWNEILDQLHIIDKTVIAPLDIESLISREDASKRSTQATAIEGEEYTWQFRMEQYNYEKNIIEPMDISSMDPKLVLQELPKSSLIQVQINIPNHDINVKVDFDVPLDTEQAIKYISIPTDEEKILFTQKIIGISPDLKKELEAKVQAAINAANANPKDE